MPGYAAKKEIKENWAKLPGSPWTLPGSSFTVKNERLGNINIKPPYPRVAEFNVPQIRILSFQVSLLFQRDFMLFSLNLFLLYLNMSFDLPLVQIIFLNFILENYFSDNP